MSCISTVVLIVHGQENGQKWQQPINLFVSINITVKFQVTIVFRLAITLKEKDELLQMVLYHHFQ